MKDILKYSGTEVRPKTFVCFDKFKTIAKYVKNLFTIPWMNKTWWMMFLLTIYLFVLFCSLGFNIFTKTVDRIGAMGFVHGESWENEIWEQGKQ